MKRRIRFRILDLCLVLLVVSSTVGTALRWWDLRAPTESEEEASVTLFASGLAPETADCVAVGELLYRADGEVWGRIRAIDKSPTRVTLESGGHFYTGEWDPATKCDLTLTVTASGHWDGALFLQGGIRALLPGAEETVYSLRAAFPVKLLRIHSESGKN